MSLLAGGLINGNAVVTFEASTITQDSEGGTSEAYSSHTTGLSVLLTQDSADRTDGLGGEHNKLTGTLTGANAIHARVDGRYLVTAGPYGLTGIYLYPENASVHGAAGEGLMGAAPWYVVKWSSVRTT